jgi:hypothetical protein
MAADLVPVEPPDGEDVGLSPRQISALEQLSALGAGPKLPTDEKYHSNPQIRALQMVYEGKLGGPGRGQGRPGREERISVQLQSYVRQNLGKKVTRALERALNQSAGERINASKPLRASCATTVRRTTTSFMTGCVHHLGVNIPRVAVCPDHVARVSIPR